MFRKDLFLDSVHKLGLSKSNESAVCSLLEAVFDNSDVNSTVDGDAAETAPTGMVDDELRQISGAFQRFEEWLDVYRNATVGMPRLPNVPADRILDELEYLLSEYDVSAELGDIRQTIQMISWNVIQFNKADSPLHKWNPMYNPDDAKGNAIAMIRCYIERIDDAVKTIKDLTKATLD